MDDKSSPERGAALVRERINRLPLGRIADDAWAHGLLQRHPDAASKIGCGVAGFEVRPGKYGKARCLAVVRLDGTSEVFSWQKCLGRLGPIAIRDGAYRLAVEEQVAPLRRGAGWHVDHEEPWTFARIVDAFISTHPSLAALPLHDSVDGFGKQLARDVAEAFAEFHRQRASLVVVPARDNMRRAASQRRVRR